MISDIDELFEDDSTGLNEFEDDKKETESSKDWQLRLESKYGRFILWIFQKPYLNKELRLQARKKKTSVIVTTAES